ncbi:MAG TPA: YgaP-like transmembrane domain [Candidatus Acidoferrales bacterium]|nr:YgaP-like transmembrane domain [Candidatus Acidoferrales bacterium]
MPILPNLGPMARMVSVALGLVVGLYGIFAVEADWLRILCALLAVWLITEGLIGFSTVVRLFRGSDQRR